MKQSLC